MKAPRDMRTIQIDITNACTHKCSNCTRFCGHHKKNYFMELDFVKKAIDSLEGFNGVIGIMGGEPTLHPKFHEIAEYVGSKYNNQNKDLLNPQKEFMKGIYNLELSYITLKDNEKSSGRTVTMKSPGLWSTMGKHYQKHYEIIQDTFKEQVLNDHTNEMYHDPLLVSRKELGIPDDEWVVLRDNCWIQNEWSASITPKGAFFCEVAGSLDMLFDGPGGWKVEPGWWKRTVEDFKDQLHWCEMCGAACETYTRNANEEIDDVSPALYEKLLAIDSPQVKSGKINKIEFENGVITEKSKASSKRFESLMPYVESYYDKFNASNSVLFPKGFDAIYYINNELTEEQQTKVKDILSSQFDTIYIIYKNTDVADKCANIKSDDKYEIYNLDNIKYEDIMNSVLKVQDTSQYVTIFSDNILPKENFVEKMKEYVLNPGVLIYGNNFDNNETLKQWIDIIGDSDNSQFAIFNRIASSLKELNENFASIKSYNALIDIWKKEKMLPFDESLFPNLFETEIYEGKRYVIYGIDTRRAGRDYNSLKNKGAIIDCVVDSKADQIGQSFNEFTVENSSILKDKINDIDYIILCRHSSYRDVKPELLNTGFKLEQITLYSG